jgi:hypothetical protein
MAFALALIYLITCAVLVYRMLARKGLVATQFGVMAVFAIGYYPLPVLFKPMTTLVAYDDDQIFTALALHWLFLIALLVGAAVAQRGVWAIRPLNFGTVDAFVARNLPALAWIGFGVYFVDVATQAQSSYSVEDVSAFFEQKSAIRSVLAGVTDLSVSVIAIAYAAATLSGSRRRQSIFGAMLAVVVVVNLQWGTRLATITPIITLFAAMSVTGQTKKAWRVLAVAVLVLAVVSPFAVYMRDSMRDRQGAMLNATEVAANYQFGDNPLVRSAQSVLDRSDLIYNTIYMKDYIDREGYVGWEYYYSVLVSPIPRFLYPDKPPLLSSDGTVGGEISALTWRVMVGGLGSLTAFGGLTAYREGGWPAVILDGLADGALFVGIARWFGAGSLVARIFYAMFFVMFAVMKAPPSFLESLTSFLSLSPLVLTIFLASRLLGVGQRRARPPAIAGRAPPPWQAEASPW